MAVGTENIETLLFRVLGVGAAQTDVVVALFVAGSVVTVGEFIPFVCFQVAHKIVRFAKLGK